MSVYLTDRQGNLPAPDVYFTEGYGKATSGKNQSWTLAVGREGMWQIPLQITVMDNGLKDAESPYGYSGVYAHPGLTADQVEQCWAETWQVLREHDLVSVFLRRSPLVNQAPLHCREHVVKDKHPTVVIDVSQGEEGVWQEFKSQTRNSIRKACNEGLRGSVRRATPADICHDSAFRVLYTNTMRRVQSKKEYYFSDEYYQQLLEKLGPQLLICEIKDKSDIVLAASLFMAHGNFIHDHLSASSEEGMRVRANNLLIWELAKFGCQEGFKLLHIGGGRTINDSLLRFKSGFSKRQLNYRVSGIILQEEVYASLVEEKKSYCMNKDQCLDPKFFPSYRAPVVDLGECNA